jgi:hypothetical protein
MTLMNENEKIGGNMKSREDRVRLAGQRLIDQGVDKIRAEYRQALTDGVKQPVVVVIDSRNSFGQIFLEETGGKEPARPLSAEFAVVVIALAFEDVLQELQTISAMPNGYLVVRPDDIEVFKAIGAEPGCIPVIDFAADGFLCVPVAIRVDDA